MQCLAEKMNGHLPKLKCVVWWYQQFAGWAVEDTNGPHYFAADDLIVLDRAFERVGVKFE